MNSFVDNTIPTAINVNKMTKAMMAMASIIPTIIELI